MRISILVERSFMHMNKAFVDRTMFGTSSTH
jgi:hypothetical protein